jgi:RimJ/RimL family protein N-acetyltransferase
VPVIATRFETERLAMLPLETRYAEEMAGVLAAPEIYAFTGGEPPTVEALASRYERQTKGPDRPGEYWLNWVLQQNETLVGYVQATVTDDEAEIAWVIGTAWQGRGYAKEAAVGLVTWLEAHGARRIVATIHPDHAASAAVSAAAGLTRTEVMQDGEYRWQK